jgi:hypothetical protein
VQNAPAQGSPTPAPQGSPSVEALTAQLAEARRIADLVTSRRQEPAAPPAPPEPPKPAFQFSAESLPQQVRDLLTSEDSNERLQGFVLLSTAVANLVHKKVNEEAVSVYQPRFMDAVRQNAAAERAKEEIGRTFYGENPQLNTAEGRQVAQYASLQVMQEYAAAGKQVAWNAQFKADLLKKVAAIAPALAQKPTPQPKPQAKPQVRGTPGVRPASPAPNSDAQIIADLLDFS